ncbi:MAG: 50S ribosomal protein L21 [Planctomycetes bacterium]|nr:50S ribosomal protein L21 [Planctomycetota bacterium]
MYAIFRDRGRQYKARVGDLVDIDLLQGASDGATVQFSEVLFSSSEDGAQVKVGTPAVAGGQVTATVVKSDFKDKKVEVVHFRAKKDSMDKAGHRQRFTRVKIDKIEA